MRRPNADPHRPRSSAEQRMQERNLVLNAHGGDPSARRALWTLLQPVLLRVARRLLATVRAALDPADLAQEGWLALCRRDWACLRAFDPALSSLRHFVAVASRRAMQGVLRRRGRSGTHEAPVAPDFTRELSGPDEEHQHLVRDEVRAVLHVLKASVPDTTWVCFSRSVIGGSTVPELMTELGVSRAAIDVRLSRARAEARQARVALSA